MQESFESRRKQFNIKDYFLFFNYLLKITICSMYSIHGKSYKIVPISNLTKMNTWTKSYKGRKRNMIIILMKNTKKNYA
jgi:hypothetical protein